MNRAFRKKTYFNLLDIGSSKIACLVVRLTDNKYAEVVGASCVPSKGIQAGGHLGLRGSDCLYWGSSASGRKTS